MRNKRDVRFFNIRDKGKDLNYPHWETADTGHETPCWLWRWGDKRSDRYTRISHRGRLEYTHIIMYRIHIGDIPTGFEVDHLCNRRDCINPKHLEAVSAIENARRRGQRNKLKAVNAPLIVQNFDEKSSASPLESGS